MGEVRSSSSKTSKSIGICALRTKDIKYLRVELNPNAMIEWPLFINRLYPGSKNRLDIKFKNYVKNY
jgi:hypothetical protein